MMNVNTKSHWDGRFNSGDWNVVGGHAQTSQFARAQVKRIPLSSRFSGRIIDFGCGAGDAAPIFRKAWPRATLCGIDFSKAAIDLAASRFGDIAEFVVGSHDSCPEADVIIASNVMEHLDDDIEVVRKLLGKCQDLYVIVPFEEQFLIDEHIRRYNRSSFSSFDVRNIAVFACRGWSHYGLRDRWWNVHAKNLLRPLFGRVKLNRRLQVMYRIKGRLDD